MPSVASLELTLAAAAAAPADASDYCDRVHTSAPPACPVRPMESPRAQTSPGNDRADRRSACPCIFRKAFHVSITDSDVGLAWSVVHLGKIGTGAAIIAA